MGVASFAANTLKVKEKLWMVVVQFYQQRQPLTKPKQHGRKNILFCITANRDFGWIRVCF
jgi:hypothetical protein